MTKEPVVWAIKLNPSWVELRVTSKPATILKSILTKTIMLKQWDNWEGRYRNMPRTTILKQASLIGGKLISVVPTLKLHNKIVGITFSKSDVVKLNTEQTILVLDRRWRKANL